MNQAYLEHANISVSNPDISAKHLCDLFDWKVRWSGPSMDDGYTVHVGGQNSYIALYNCDKVKIHTNQDHTHLTHLNHIAVVVENLEETRKRATDLGFKPFNFREYNPGRSFYLLDNDGLEIEVVCYN